MATIAKIEFAFHKVDNKNSNNYNVNLIYNFYHNVCKNIFDKHELEDYQKWLDALDNNKNIYTYEQKNYHLYTYFVIITLNDKVIGGVVNEIYQKSMCSLISYIAIDEKFRGYGLSKKLIDKSIIETLTLNKNIKHIFIEVITPENEKDIDRQHIWNKLNFTPLDFIFQHPGCLKWKYYQIAAYSRNDNNSVSILKSDLIIFFEEFFESIIGNSEKNKLELELELDKIKKNLTNNKSKYVIGNKNLWKSYS
jgi:hypothetical protein